jgi:hypothetical protein
VARKGPLGPGGDGVVSVMPWAWSPGVVDESETEAVYELCRGLDVEVDLRTGVAYTQVTDDSIIGGWLVTDEIDELGLGPDGEHMRRASRG